MLSLHTNAASLSTQNSLASTNKALGSSMTKLGTGYRVNSAMDDAAGLQIATRLNAQTSGMKVAQKNTQNGISMLQTAEGALSEIGNMLIRMKDLATESATASTSADDRVAMQAEYDALATEMSNIFATTSFGGALLFGASGTGADRTKALLDTATLKFQIGSSKEEQMVVDGKTGLDKLAEKLQAVSYKFIAGTNAKADAAAAEGEQELTGLAYGTDLKVKTDAKDDLGENANAMIETLEDAINLVASYRSELGAASNRLEHTYNNLSNMIQNTSAAMGRIMDVDYATETSNMTSKQMLMQASTSMLKQSNSMSQMVASLLQ